jgi:WD40 repeat protein
MTDKTQNPNLQPDHNSMAAGDINVDGSIEGSLIIGSHNVVGYTAEQVSVLIKDISTTFQPKPFDGRSPYKGLDYFEEEDAELFFGREKLVEDLVGRVKESRTLFVTGPSGSGKSSLVRAGLIHALHQGKIKNSERWLYGVMKPGREPIAKLARVTSKLAKSTNAEEEICARAAADPTIFRRWCEIALGDGKDERVVIFIDQFEEVFTQINKEIANTFIDLLDNAVSFENGRVILLFAMRSDFVSNCATYPKLNALLNRQFMQVGAMRPEELVSAIAQPALRVGLRIDPDLIAQIINDMQGEPGALPLMQFALKDLFDSQQSQRGVIALTLNDYLQRGGVRKALERHADASFNKLDSHEQELACSIFSGLIEIGRGTQDTRRTAIFDELVSANTNAAEARRVLQKLADARLIATDEMRGKETVTLAHEKLIEAWPWLKKLVDENREVIALQNAIATDAKEWDEHGRDSSYLYAGARLAVAQEGLAAKKILLSGRAKEYIEVGIVLREAERKAKESQRRKTVVGLATGIAIALLLAGLALYQMVQAQEQTRLARIGELSAQSVSLRDRNFQLALLLGVEANHGPVTTQSIGTLFDNVRSNLQLRTYLNEHTDPVSSVALSPDGKTLASGSYDNTIILWDVRTNQPIGQPLTGHKNWVSSVAFSPNGKTLASGSWDHNIILWDVTIGKQIGGPLSQHTNAVRSVAFSPDGKILASGSEDNTIVLWDLATGQPIGQPLTRHAGFVYSVAFSPDGTTLASGSTDNSIILWDVATGQPIGEPLTGHTDAVISVAFSPDGTTLASGSADNTIILWEVTTGKPIGQPLNGYTDVVYSVAFSPDGKTLASGSWDHNIILWDVTTGKPIGQPLKGHDGAVRSVAFSPDGKMLASGSNDNTIILWDIRKSQSLGQPLKGHHGAVRSVAFSPDGKVLASASADNTIILWDVATGKPIGQPLTGHKRWVLRLVFSPDGKILASGSWDHTIILWDVATGKPIGQPLTKHTDNVWSVAFSPDGKILASGSADNSIILWDVATAQPIGQPLTKHTDNVWSVAFSPDGKILASGSADNSIILWDVATAQPIGQPLIGHTDIVTSVAFSPNGKILASGSGDTTVILWDISTVLNTSMATSQSILQRLAGHTDVVYSVAFSPDGKTLASGSADNTIILWDVTTAQPIGQPITGHTKGLFSVAFSPDGKTLASGSADNSIILWDVSFQKWIENCCQRAGRNLTLDEWQKYFPSEEYRKTCERFPFETTSTGVP